MVRNALNAISEESETFIQRILGRASLPDWEELWETLCQEEIRWLTKVGSSDEGARVKKEEEEDVALASIGKQGKRKKKELSKIKCLNCGNWAIMQPSVRGRRIREGRLTPRQCQRRQRRS